MPFLKLAMVLIALIFSSVVYSCELTMGYRTSERLPLIAAAPDNSGLYSDLFNEASKRMGCQLTIKRLPKKRILTGMKAGEIDFYPGFTFTDSRSEYAYFIPNGLTLSTRIISHINSPEINKIEDMKGGVMLRANGSPSFGVEKHGVSISTIENLDLPKAIKMIEKGRADYYKYYYMTLKYYLKSRPKAQVKINPCCGQPKNMFLGFSRLSKHYKEKIRSDFAPHLPLSPSNIPYEITSESLPAQLQQTIEKLAKDGFIEKLNKKYYD